MTNRNLGGYQIQAAGHGDIIQDRDGNWWFAHLAFRQIHKWLTFHHLGREGCLVPMKWRDDGWFDIGVNGICPMEVELPDTISFRPQDFSFDKTFKNLDEKLDWVYLRHPHMDNYVFDENSLKIRGTGINLDAVDSPSFAAVRQTEFDLDITCEITPNTQEAGICFYADENHHYEIITQSDSHGTKAFLKQTIGCISAVSDIVSSDSSTVRVHIKTEAEKYHFYVVTDNDEIYLGKAETRYLSSEVAGGFTGTMIGFYAVNEMETDVWSIFSNLHIIHRQ